MTVSFKFGMVSFWPKVEGGVTVYKIVGWIQLVFGDVWVQVSYGGWSHILVACRQWTSSERCSFSIAAGTEHHGLRGGNSPSVTSQSCRSETWCGWHLAKIGSWQDCTPCWRWRRESVSWSFPISPGHLHSWAPGPFLQLQSSIIASLWPITVSCGFLWNTTSVFQDPLGNLGSSPHVSVLNHIHTICFVM